MSKRILVVEDQPDNRQIIRDMLADTDYEITEAEDGEQALAAVKKERPDLILMGVQLPIMDGYEVTRQIKEPKIWKRHLAKALFKCLILLVPGERFELPTNGLQKRGADHPSHCFAAVIEVMSAVPVPVFVRPERDPATSSFCRNA